MPTAWITAGRRREHPGDVVRCSSVRVLYERALAIEIKETGERA